MNTSPPPESSSRSAAAPTRTTPGTIVIGSTCWAVMTPMIADPQTPRPSCVYYCTLRTLAPAIQHTKVHVKALDARLGALPCQESWIQAASLEDLVTFPHDHKCALGMLEAWARRPQHAVCGQRRPSRALIRVQPEQPRDLNRIFAASDAEAHGEARNVTSEVMRRETCGIAPRGHTPLPLGEASSQPNISLGFGDTPHGPLKMPERLRSLIGASGRVITRIVAGRLRLIGRERIREHDVRPGGGR